MEAITTLKQILARAVCPYESIRPILRGPLKGMKFKIVPGMGLTYALGIDSFYFKELGTRLHSAKVIYDIGANQGQMSLFFSKLVGPKGRVFAFEPHTMLCENLRFNAQLNALSNLDVRCVAVGAENGEAKFEFDKRHPTQGKLAGCEPSYRMTGAQLSTVKMVALDKLLESGLPGPDFLKIDVEGGAKGVLKGATQLLSKYSPLVYIELHGPEEQSAVQEYLLGGGYVVETLSGIRITDDVSSFSSPLWCFKPS